MSKDHISELVHYRKRMKLTQFQVARLLGWKSTKGLCQIESGKGLPTLMTAFKLGIIYRVPIEFMFSSIYQELREHIRAKEASLVSIGQHPLPLTFSDVSHS